MKRKGQLFNICCSFEHLLYAYSKARKGSNTPEAKRFGFFLEKELLVLQQLLQTEQYQPANYHYFQIHDPKKRTISVAPFCDRVVHHALVGVLEPIFDPCFIYHSYATRKEKGVHKALVTAQQKLRKYLWFYKADVQKFFDSISHDRLLEIVSRKVKDKQLLSLTEKIIRNGGQEGYGLPIGNLTSQFFANVYLNPFDHFMLQTALPAIGGGAYIRYMDDFVCFAQKNSEVKTLQLMVKKWLLENLGLGLNPNSTFINQRSNGLRFLGARIYPTIIRLHRTNQRRFRRRIAYRVKQYESGKMTEEEFLQSMNSYWSHLQHFDARKFRESLLSIHNEILL